MDVENAHGLSCRVRSNYNDVLLVTRMSYLMAMAFQIKIAIVRGGMIKLSAIMIFALGLTIGTTRPQTWWVTQGRRRPVIMTLLINRR